jgi:hypothetical protein
VVLALQAQQIHLDTDLNAEPHNRAIEAKHHTLLIANVQYGNENAVMEGMEFDLNLV